jgi:hypothetical protein
MSRPIWVVGFKFTSGNDKEWRPIFTYGDIGSDLYVSGAWPTRELARKSAKLMQKTNPYNQEPPGNKWLYGSDYKFKPLVVYSVRKYTYERPAGTPWY